MHQLSDFPLLQRLKHWLEPPKTIHGIERRKQYQLLAGLYVILAPLCVLLAVVSNVVIGQVPLLRDGLFLLSIAFAAMLGIAAYANRHGHILTSVRITVGAMSFVIVTSGLYLWTPGWSNSAFFGLIIPFVFGLAFFSIRELAMLIAVNFVAVVIGVWSHPIIQLADVIDVLLFVVLAGVLVGLFNRYYQSIEAERRLELEEERARLRDILDHMPVMLDALDEQFSMILWNKECERVTGYTAAEMQAHPQPLSMLYTEAQRQAMEAEWAQRGQDFRDWEISVRCKDGQERVISWSSIAGSHPIPGWSSWAIGIDVTERKQAEAALIEGEARLRGILDHMPVLFNAFDGQSQIVFWNQECERVTGFSAAEIMGRDRPLSLLYSAEDYANVRKVFTNMSADYRDWELTLTSKDGSPHTILWSSMAGSYPVSGWAMWSVGVDITARRQAERTLAENEARLSGILEHMPVLLDAFDAENRLVLWNKECERVTGFSAEEILGHPEPLRLLYSPEAYDHMVETRPSFGEDFRDWELTLTSKDGTPRTILWSSIAESYPVPAWKFWGVGVDVTARRQAERTLAENEARLRFVLQNSPMMLYMIDNNGIFTLSEGKVLALIGLKPGEAVGRSVYELYKNSPIILSNIRNALTGNSCHFMTYSYEHHWDHIFEPVFDNHDNVIGMIGTSIDITERTKLEEQQWALALEKARSDVLRQIIRDVTHDLQTPISGIKTIAYLLARHADDPRHEQWVQSVKSLTDRLGQMVADMLMMSQLDEQPAISQTEGSFDLNLLCAQMAAELGPLAEAKELRLRTVLDREAITLEGNSLQISRVLQNLISNAILYTPKGGEVVVTTEKTAGRVRFAVEDTGIGISPEDQVRIFERFYRVDSSRSSATGGSGLGLSIAQKIVEAHGGRITVQSVPQKGSVFTVELPTAQPRRENEENSKT